MAAINGQSGDGAIHSPNSQRPVVTSPWNQIVRGGSGELEVVSPAVPDPASPSFGSNVATDWSPVKVAPETVSSPDESVVGSDNVSKKPVWNRPSNGVVEVVSPVMGTAWPALGESTKAAVKSSSSESLKTLSDGLLTPALQVTGSSSPSHKQATASNVNSSLTPNHVGSPRRSKRGGGNSNSSASANGVISQPPPLTQGSVAEAPHNTSGKPGSVAEHPSPKDHTHKESQRANFGSQSHSGNDHHHPRGPHRRGNGGQHPRGDGSYHNNYGGKRDQDRGNQEWNQQSRSFNNRDTHMQSQRGFGRGYMRPSVHTPASFIPPPLPLPVQSFGNNMMYPDMASPLFYMSGPPPDSVRAMHFAPPVPPAMYFVDPQLYANIVTQIDYYFSNENLVRDTYLRQNMDEQGWVSVSLIAGFKKVSYLTDNVQLILDAMRTSTIVEVQGDKIRRRNDWMKWIIPSPGQFSNPSSPHVNHEGLVPQFQGLALQESAEHFSNKSSSEEFTQAGIEAMGRVSNQ